MVKANCSNSGGVVARTVTDDRLEQLWKADEPMAVTLAGMYIDVRPDPVKAPWLILVTLEGISIVVKALQGGAHESRMNKRTLGLMLGSMLGLAIRPNVV